MSNGWTEEHRAKQAEAIRRWKPWAKSTGPKTPAGKAVASKNAIKTGVRAREWFALQKSVDALLAETDKTMQDVNL